MDEEGESSWVFECRDVSRSFWAVRDESHCSQTAPQPSRPANPIDEKYAKNRVYIRAELMILFKITLVLYQDVLGEWKLRTSYQMSIR